eukprot:TCONS_00071584-protein
MMELGKILLVSIVIATVSIKDSVNSEDAAEMEKYAKKYLTKYGYKSNWLLIYSKYSYEKDLRTFQAYFGQRVSGVLTEETYSLMKQERCGMSDVGFRLGKETEQEKKHDFVLQGTKWTKNTILWDFKSFPKHSKQQREKYNKIITKSFERWSKHTNLRFEKSSLNPDIVINITKDFHRDPYPFTKEFKDLGHAFYPLSQRGLAGDIHLNQDLVEGKADADFNWLFTHMIGHSLGIEHTNDPTSIMYPINKNFQNEADFQISTGDRLAVQQLYGKPPALKTTVKTQKTKPTTGTIQTSTVKQSVDKITTTPPAMRISTLTTPATTTTSPTTTTTSPTTTKTTPTTTTTTTTIPKTTTTTSTTTTTTPITTTTIPVTTTTTPTTTTTIPSKSTITTPSRTTTTQLNVNRKTCPEFEVTALVYYPFHKRLLVYLQSDKIMMVNSKGVSYTTSRYALIARRGEYLKCVDASATVRIRAKDYMVVFSKDSYFLYHLRYFQFASGPHSIHNGQNPLKLKMPPWVHKIDASMTIKGQLYIFNTRYVWKTNLNNLQITDEGQAKNIQNVFPGVPNDLSAAFSGVHQEKMLTYFVKNDLIYLYNERTKKVMDGYPKHWGETILNCKDAGKNVINVRH